MRILDLFFASLMVNLKLLLLTAFGTVLALERFDILGQEATKHINIISFYAFSPAMFVSNLAQTMTHEKLAILWFMPLNILTSFIIGSILGWILLKIVQVPHTLRGLVLGCCVAGNVGTMLLVIVPSLCEERESPFGAVNVCNAQAMTYASLSMAIGGIYFWLYVYNMVRIVTSQIHNNGDEDPSQSVGKNILELSNGQLPSSDDYQAEPTSTERKQKVRKLAEEIIFHIKDVAVKYLNLKSLFTPSTIGAIVGLTIGITPPFRKAFIGPSAPLHVLHDTASLLGAAFIPSITLITGANLLRGLRKSDLKLSALVLIMVIRYILMPIIGIAIVKGGVRLRMIPSDQPLYQFVLLLQYSVPPAINMTTITQLIGVGEKECSVILLATYAAAPAALTLWSTFFLWLVHGQHM